MFIRSQDALIASDTEMMNSDAVEWMVELIPSVGVVRDVLCGADGNTRSSCVDAVG